MKKILMILLLSVFVGNLIGCGNKEVNSTHGSDNVETFEIIENSVEEEKEIKLPDIAYDEWLTDEAGNKLFGFNVPAGWEILERRSERSVTLQSTINSNYQIGVYCVPFEQGSRIPDIYTTGKCEILEDVYTYTEDGTTETIYGTFKFVAETALEEGFGGSELALLKQNEQWCVGIDVWLPFDYSIEEDKGEELFRVSLIKNIVNAMINETSNEYEYPHWLVDENGRKIIGFQEPEGFAVSEAVVWKNEWNTNVVSMGNDDMKWTKYIIVDDISIEKAYQMVRGWYVSEGQDYTETYTVKKEMDTGYGTVVIYEYLLEGENVDVYRDMALMNVNGSYVAIEYDDTSAVSYTGELENIITQLFAQE